MRADGAQHGLRRLLAGLQGRGAITQRVTTPEYMCQGWTAAGLIVILSGPASASSVSSLPNDRTENGQVGSRKTSNTRSPCPHSSGSARQDVCVI